MEKVRIDLEKCIGCGQCAADCVGFCIQMKNGKPEMTPSGCIACGHCYAVCPVEAVTMPGMEPGGEEYVSMTEFDSKRLLEAMKSRRSIRRFKAVPVEQEKIDMILEAGRYCPTGSNMQDVAYTILGSKQNAIEADCVALFGKGVGAAAKVSATAKRFVIDDHFFFKGAPLVIVVSGKSKGNANLASAYMELMAESLGLGVLYSGFFVAAASFSGKVRRALELPKGHKPITCLVIGYPDVKYRRIPGRKPLQMKKL